MRLSQIDYIGKQQEILNKLRDDDEYYNGIGLQYLSASTLKKYTNTICPELERKQDFIHPLEFGNAFHQSLLEPSKFTKRSWAPEGTTNALTEDDRRHCELLQSKVMENSVARSVLEDGNNEFEVPFIGKFDGIDLKCKVDILSNDGLWDLKTTGNLDATDYTEDLWGYPLSAWQYYMLTGKTMNFIYVEKNSGRVKIRYTDQKYYKKGRDAWAHAFRNYKKSLLREWIPLGVQNKIDDIDAFNKKYSVLFKQDANGRTSAFVKNYKLTAI